MIPTLAPSHTDSEMMNWNIDWIWGIREQIVAVGDVDADCGGTKNVHIVGQLNLQARPSMPWTVFLL